MPRAETGFPETQLSRSPQSVALSALDLFLNAFLAFAQMAGVSMPPKMSQPVLVGVSDTFVHFAAKLFLCIGGGTNIELAFVDEED